MKSPEQSAKTSGTITKVFVIILLIGVAIVAYPFATGEESSNAIGMVVFGSFIAFMGLTGIIVMRNRKKAMDTILSGDSIIDQWEDQELGTIVLSTEGFFLAGELYTMKGYSCSVAKAEIKNGELFIQYLTARRSGHQRHKTNVAIPYGHEPGVQRFIEAVKKAWGDKNPLYEQESNEDDFEDEYEDE